MPTLDLHRSLSWWRYSRPLKEVFKTWCLVNNGLCTEIMMWEKKFNAWKRVLYNVLQDKNEYIISFTKPTNEMLSITDTNKLSLHFVYNMCNIMIERVNSVIYRHEGKKRWQGIFYVAVHTILVDHWNKSNKPCHCLALIES